MSSTSTEQLTGAEQVTWDLSDLYPQIDAGVFADDKLRVEQQAKDLEQNWRGRISDCSSAELAQLLMQTQNLIEVMSRLAMRVSLEFCTDHHSPSIAASYQSINEFNNSLGRYFIFIDVELQSLSDERFEEHCAAEELRSFRHYLRSKRTFKDHILSEAEEILDSEKSMVCSSAWERFYDQMSSTRTYSFEGRQVSEQELSMYFSDPDRARRKAATEALCAGLAQAAPMNAFIFNTILSDYMIENRMRHYPSWISFRNLGNEISDNSVDALVDAVQHRYDICHRFYALKKQMLGLDDFADYDRNAPVSDDTRMVSWSEARSIVSEAYHEFDPNIGAIVDSFFDNNWIDAALRPGKQSGAFAAPTVPDVHPYILMNYTGRANDVSTLAHELGHGIHAWLARHKGLFNQNTPLTIAETASVFGEMLVFDSLMKRAENDEQRLTLIMDKLHGICSTVFRQVSFNRFEHAIHTTRKQKGELSIAQFNDLWLQTQTACYGDSVRFPAGHDQWWAVVTHFVHAPGYVYAYAFGELLVLALYELYKEGAPNFQQKYTELLSAGGSDSPQNLLKTFDINLDDPNFWSLGLRFIDSMLLQAEELMRRRESKA